MAEESCRAKLSKGFRGRIMVRPELWYHGAKGGDKNMTLGHECLNVLDWKHLVSVNIWCVSGDVLPDTGGFIWEHKNGNSCEMLGSACAHLDDLKGQVEIHFFFFLVLSLIFPCLLSNTSTLRTKGN